MLRLQLEIKPSRLLLLYLMSCYLPLLWCLSFWPLLWAVKMFLLLLFLTLLAWAAYSLCFKNYRSLHFLKLDKGQWFYVDTTHVEKALKLLPQSRLLGAFVFLHFEEQNVELQLQKSERKQKCNWRHAKRVHKKYSWILLADSLPLEQWSALRRWMLLQPQVLLTPTSDIKQDDERTK